MELDRKKGLDLLQIAGGFLFLFLLPKLQKNLHYLFSKCFADVPPYSYLNLFDCFLVGAGLYCIVKRVSLVAFFREHKSFLCLLLFLIWTRISLMKVAPEYLSRAHVLFFGLFASCMCFPLLSLEFFQKKVFKHFYTLLILFVIFSSFECVIGFSQFILQKPLNLPFLKEWGSLDSFLTSGHPLSQLYIGKIFHFSDSNLILRSYGTMSHPNIFGGFLSLSCLALYFLFPYQRILTSFLLFGHILTLFTTFSRSSGLLFLWLTFLFLLYSIKRLSKASLGSLLSVICLSCATGFVLFSSFAIERACSLPISSEKIAANSPRIRGFLVAKEMIQANPLSGVGYRQFVNQMDPYIRVENAEVEKLPAHNIYLLIAAELGLIGLFLFACFLFFAFNGSFSHPLHFFVFAAITGVLLVGLFDCYPWTCFFWRMTFFALLGAGCKSFKESERLNVIGPGEKKISLGFFQFPPS